MARTGIEHSFLPGQNLWSRPDQHTAIVAACASDHIGAEDPKPACTAFLTASDKAAEEWELEHRFQVFESTRP